MSARFDRHLTGPRRKVRYVYLIEAWPDGAHLDHLDAFEQAPDAAVIAALTKEVEVYGDVITRERQRADEADAALDRLRDAIEHAFGAAVLEVLATDESATA